MGCLQRSLDISLRQLAHHFTKSSGNRPDIEQRIAAGEEEWEFRRIPALIPC